MNIGKEGKTKQKYRNSMPLLLKISQFQHHNFLLRFAVLGEAFQSFLHSIADIVYLCQIVTHAKAIAQVNALEKFQPFIWHELTLIPIRYYYCMQYIHKTLFAQLWCQNVFLYVYWWPSIKNWISWDNRESILICLKIFSFFLSWTSSHSNFQLGW